nr:MAG TPA: hypothetical protein [Caudoviricetes sp.]
MLNLFFSIQSFHFKIYLSSFNYIIGAVFSMF